MSIVAAAGTAAKANTGQYAAQLGMQVGAQASGGALNNIVNRMFRKKDRKTNWKESQRYGERNMNWEKQLAQYNQNLSMQMADKNQAMAKEYFDYTSAYESPEEEMKRLKAAGLNPALMYGQNAAGGSGQTGGATAQTPKAEAPTEQYRPMGMADGTGGGMGIMALRETEAERELKLAQAENLRSEKDEREGIGKNLKQAQIDAIQEGISSDKAKTALTEAQRQAVELETRIKETTEQDTVDIVMWTAKQVQKQFEMASDEAYISKATREEKIGILRQTLLTSVIDANLKKAAIKHIGKEDEKLDADITNITNQIVDRVHGWTQWEKGYKLDQLKHELDKSKLELEREMSKYVGIDKLGGKIFDQAIVTIWNSVSIIDKLLGEKTPDNWR